MDVGERAYVTIRLKSAVRRVSGCVRAKLKAVWMLFVAIVNDEVSNMSK